MGLWFDVFVEDLLCIWVCWEKLNFVLICYILIFIGGGGEKKMLKIVVEYVDIWYSFLDMVILECKFGIFDGWCEEVGCDL